VLPARTLAIALAGIPPYVASFGSWTIVAPPIALIRADHDQVAACPGLLGGVSDCTW